MSDQKSVEVEQEIEKNKIKEDGILCFAYRAGYSARDAEVQSLRQVIHSFAKNIAEISNIVGFKGEESDELVFAVKDAVSKRVMLGGLDKGINITQFESEINRLTYELDKSRIDHQDKITALEQALAVAEDALYHLDRHGTLEKIKAIREGK